MQRVHQGYQGGSEGAKISPTHSRTKSKANVPQQKSSSHTIVFETKLQNNLNKTLRNLSFAREQVVADRFMLWADTTEGRYAFRALTQYAQEVNHALTRALHHSVVCPSDHDEPIQPTSRFMDWVRADDTSDENLSENDSYEESEVFLGGQKKRVRTQTRDEVKEKLLRIDSIKFARYPCLHLL